MSMSPLVLYPRVKAKAPGLQDNTADLDRLRQVLEHGLPGERPLRIPFERMTTLTRSFREAGFSGHAVVNNLPDSFQLVDFHQKKREVLPAMALDLGTTHLEASLLDLLTGRRLATSDRENSQIRFGADILSRIHHATAGRRRHKRVEKDFLDPGLVELQEVICDDLNGLARSLARQAGQEITDIRALSVSGNTTMVHLLLGLDPYHMCREPYIPMVNGLEPIPARELGLAIHPLAPVWIMPSIGSYFGGDLISGIVASGMASGQETRMLIDVGTNAEVVLGNSEWMIGCAGAAGPALEGGVARMGMRAGPGAIEWVHIDPETFKLSYRTIGDVPPCGICGSGLIDLAASLFLSGLIDIRGRFRDPEKETRPERAGFMREHLISSTNETGFVVATAQEAEGQEAVVLEQIDLDAMIRSKAAMYAILTTLINQVGLDFSDLKEICVAGAFGRHINPKSAVTLGMLPDLDLSVYRVIGNSSLAGAEKVLLDGEARRECLRIVKTITYLELNVNQEFMIRFSGSKFIPHTDPTLFPSVPGPNHGKK